jgi:hypothetical protein
LLARVRILNVLEDFVLDDPNPVCAMREWYDNCSIEIKPKVGEARLVLEDADDAWQ